MRLGSTHAITRMSKQLDEPMPLERLLSGTAQGDSRAFTELYERTSPRLFGVCLSLPGFTHV